MNHCFNVTQSSHSVTCVPWAWGKGKGALILTFWPVYPFVVCPHIKFVINLGLALDIGPHHSVISSVTIRQVLPSCQPLYFLVYIHCFTFSVTFVINPELLLSYRGRTSATMMTEARRIRGMVRLLTARYAFGNTNSIERAP